MYNVVINTTRKYAMSKQAENIIKKFGGAGRLAVALGKPRSTIYKWTYPTEKGGTGGVIPHWNYGAIKEIADLNGIELTEEDFII